MHLNQSDTLVILNEIARQLTAKGCTSVRVHRTERAVSFTKPNGYLGTVRPQRPVPLGGDVRFILDLAAGHGRRAVWPQYFGCLAYRVPLAAFPGAAASVADFAIDGLNPVEVVPGGSVEMRSIR